MNGSVIVLLSGFPAGGGRRSLMSYCIMCFSQTQYMIKVQMLEIYNESLRDLFRAGGGSQAAKLELLNTQASGCNVRNAEQVGRAAPCIALADVARVPRTRPCAIYLYSAISASATSDDEARPPASIPARWRWRAPLWSWSSWPGGLGTGMSLRPT